MLGNRGGGEGEEEWEQGRGGRAEVLQWTSSPSGMEKGEIPPLALWCKGKAWLGRLPQPKPSLHDQSSDVFRYVV